VLADSFPFKTLMRRIEKHYPKPTPITPAEFSQITNDYLYLPVDRPAVIIRQPGASAK